MKKSDLATSIALVPIDFIMLVAAGLTSYGLRYQSIITRYRPVFFDYPFSEFFPSLVLIAVTGLIIFAFTGSYTVTSKQKMTDILAKAFFGVSTTILIVIVAVFLKRELFSSRFVVILAWLLATVYVIIGRLIVFRIKAALLRRGIGIHGLVIVGTGKTYDDLYTFFAKNPKLGYRCIEQFAQLDEVAKNRILELMQRREVDEILDTREAIDRESFVEALNFCHEHGLNFRYVAGVYQTKTINMETDSIAGYPVIQINRTPLKGWGRVYKRTFDLIFSVAGLILMAPFALLIALGIKLDSEGPVLVRLSRVGRNGSVFTVYKFRSMVKGAQALKPVIMGQNERSDGPLFKMKDDPRITVFGRFLRKTSIDELPQFWNVFTGTMSLVGPRPHEPQEVRQYDQAYRSLLGIKPGLTGMAQVSGRSNLLFREEAALDLYYIENWSLLLDLRICLKTIRVVFRFKDAA